MLSPGMTADDYERQTHGMLKFLREWDYIQNCQGDMFLPQFVPPFRMIGDTGLRECQSADAPAIFKEER